MNKHWKEAASIIIACRANLFKSSKQVNGIGKKYESSDFKILVLKRGKTSRFFPGGYVFPGGTTEEADSSNEWLSLYESCGLKPEYLNKLVSSTPRTPVFSDDSKPLHKSLALRITAIRETFEESGVLLCKTNTSATTWASFLAGHEIKQWQNIVQKNPYEFVNLCKKFECFPDLWSLHQWSNWLTPTNNPIRFDTAFFLATLDQLPPSFVNYEEMEDIKWCTPNELLEGHDSARLPPPQCYEISRIATLESIEQLNNFAVQRAVHGCERWMPIQKRANDGVVCFLPGDDLYPGNIDYNIKDKMGVIEGTMEDLRKGVQRIHRMELYENEGTRIVVSNIKPSCGHVLPRISNSKL